MKTKTITFKLSTSQKALPDDELLDIEDMVILLHLRCATSLRNELKKERVPAPDKRVRTTGRYPKQVWSIGYLRQFEGQQFNVTVGK